MQASPDIAESWSLYSPRSLARFNIQPCPWPRQLNTGSGTHCQYPFRGYSPLSSISTEISISRNLKGSSVLYQSFCITSSAPDNSLMWPFRGSKGWTAVLYASLLRGNLFSRLGNSLVLNADFKGCTDSLVN